MNQIQRRRTGRSRAKLAGKEELIKKYPHRMQLYKVPPVDEITLEEFEFFGYERLKVLKAVEAARLRHGVKKDQMVQAIEQACKKYMPLSSNRDTDEGLQVYDQRRKDHISHFVLRLSFCRTEDQRRWFLQQEVDLFRARFESHGEDINEFLKANNLDYTEVEDVEKQGIQQELADCVFVGGRDASALEIVEKTPYYKLPFEQALDLVRGRKVFLKKGFAYVPVHDLISIICADFRAMLSQALVLTSKALPSMEEDERLDPILRTLTKTDLGAEYQVNAKYAGKVSMGQLDELSRTSYPLCMKNLHQQLRASHHLKHWGRLQYGLFLKGIGLTLEEALNFWRSEFSKTMPMDKFDKDYAYSIRHSYGKEGKRTNYTPYSCTKIITGGQPQPGHHNGCPFKHFDEYHLKAKLQEASVPHTTQQEILKLVKEQHFQVACGKYFEAMHKVTEGPMINHPNQYFDESMKLRNGGDARDTNTPAPTTAGTGGVAGAASQATNTPTEEKDFDDGMDDDALMEMDLDG